MHFNKAANRRLRLADVPRESGTADRLLDNSRQMIRLDLLDESPRNPRSTVDEASLRELADSIAEHGLLQAPLVRRHPDDPDRYQTILGARRIAAHRLLGREEIEVIVRRLDDHHAFLASCVENVQRVQLSPREELDMIGVLVDELGSQDAAARALGKSKTWLSKRKRLIGVPALAAAVERGEISLDHAYDLLTRTQDEHEVQEQLERVRTSHETQKETRGEARRRPPRVTLPPRAEAPAAVTAIESDAPSADPRALVQPARVTAPILLAVPSSAATDAPGYRLRESSPPATVPSGAPTVSDRNSMLHVPTSPATDEHDLVQFATLQTLRLASALGTYGSRPAVIQALRADLAALERQ